MTLRVVYGVVGGEVEVVGREGACYEANEGVGWRVDGLRTRRERRQRSMSDGWRANSGGKLRLDQLTRIYV